MKRYFYPEREALRPGDVAAVKAHALEVVVDRFAVVERRLAEGGPFHLGERFSLVDLTAAYWAAHLEPGALAACPALARCAARVRARARLDPKFAAFEAVTAASATPRSPGEEDRQAPCPTVTRS